MPDRLKLNEIKRFLSTGLMIYTGHRKEFSINDVLNVSPTSEQIIHTEVSNLNPVAKKNRFL